MAGAGVLASTSAVAVRPVAGSVVVVVLGAEEVTFAPVTVAQASFTVGAALTELNGEFVAGAVTAAHGLAPAAAIPLVGLCLPATRVAGVAREPPRARPGVTTAAAASSSTHEDTHPFLRLLA